MDNGYCQGDIVQAADSENIIHPAIIFFIEEVDGVNYVDVLMHNWDKRDVYEMRIREEDVLSLQNIKKLPNQTKLIFRAVSIALLTTDIEELKT